MAGLTQIGQVPGGTTPPIRRLLDHLINKPDLWITGGTLSVQASGARIGKIDLNVPDEATAGQVLTLNSSKSPEWADAITSIDFTVGTTTIAVSESIEFAGTTNEAEVTVVSGVITVGLPNDVTIGGSLDVTENVVVSGNFTVNGTTTTINTETLSVEDSFIELANGNEADTIDMGFYGLYDSGGDRYAGLFRDANGSGKFKLFKDLEDQPGTTVDTEGAGYTVASLVANVEGSLIGESISVAPKSGTDQDGTSLTISAGQGTGTGDGGSIVFQTAPEDTSGAGVNALATILTIDQDGLTLEDGKNISGFVKDNTANADNPVVFHDDAASKLHRHTGGLLYNPRTAVLSINPGSAGAAGELRFFELDASGTNHVALKAPDSLDADVTLVLPVDDGDTGQQLTTNGDGVLSWADAGSGPAGADGDDGAAAGFGTPTASTGAIGVTATGPDTAKVFAFSIPAGAAGADGDDGAAAGFGTPTASTGAIGVTASGPDTAKVFAFSIPAGAAGADGADGTDGTDGADGADGKTVLNGTDTPSSGTGTDGDFYIDTDDNEIYGPKTSGAWGSATSLVGPTGATGADGADGAATLNELSDVAYADGDLTITGLDKIVAGAIAIDSSANITLDADGGTIQFSDDGVSLGTITASGYSGTAATATTVTVAASRNDTNFPVLFHSSGTPTDDSVADPAEVARLRYNPSSGTLLVPILSAGATNVTGSSVTIADSTGTNAAGNPLTISAGAGTGTGAGGSIIFQTAPAGDSGASVNDLVTALTITSSGVVTAGAGGFSGDIDGNAATVTAISDHGIDDLSDVTISFTVTDNDILQWDGDASKWVDKSLADAGIADRDHTHDLDDLTDVTYGSGDLVITALDTLTTADTADNAAGQSLTVSGGDTTAGGQDDVAGGDLIIEGGQGKGEGAGGAVRVKVAPAGSTGNSLNSLTEVMTILPNKMIGLNADPSAAMGTLTIDGIPEASVNAFSFGSAPDFSASPHTASHDADFSAAGSLEATIVPTADLIDGENGQNGGTSGLNLVAQTAASTTFDIDDNKAVIAGDFVAKHRGAYNASDASATSKIKQAVAGNFSLSNTGHIGTAIGLGVGSGNLTKAPNPASDPPEPGFQCDHQFGIWAWSAFDKHYFNGTVGINTPDDVGDGSGVDGAGVDESYQLHVVGDTLIEGNLDLDGVATIEGNLVNVTPPTAAAGTTATNLTSSGLQTTIDATTDMSSDFTLSVANGAVFTSLVPCTVRITSDSDASVFEEFIIKSAAGGITDTITVEGGGRQQNGTALTGDDELVSGGATASLVSTLPAQVRTYVKNEFSSSSAAINTDHVSNGKSNLIVKERRRAPDSTAEQDVYFSMDLLSETSAPTVTQVTDRSTAVEINALHGTITVPATLTPANSGGESAPERFTVNNDRVSAGDLVLVAFSNDYSPEDGDTILHLESMKVVSGAFDIHYFNISSTNALSDDLEITFRVIPSSALLWNASTTEP